MATTGLMAVQNESPDSEKAKGGKKGEKTKAYSNSLTSKQAEVPDSIICHRCKQVFMDEDSKILSCDRCEFWFCVKCAHISEAGHTFLASKEAEDITWYCKPCKQPAKVAGIEDKSIKDTCKEYTEKVSQRMKTLEATLQKKAEIIGIAAEKSGR